jgi:hypothetical protein
LKIQPHELRKQQNGQGPVVTNFENPARMANELVATNCENSGKMANELVVTNFERSTVPTNLS